MQDAGGVPVRVHEAIDSTSAEARRRGEAGEAGPLWILARHQTAGYGRRGGVWQSGAGDLMATRLFALVSADPPPAQLSFVAAVALAETLRALAPGIRPQLKWPNDVLIDGAKVCGLLAELLVPAAGGPPSAATQVCLGVGLNIATAPTVPGRRTTRLADHVAGTPPSPDAALAVFETAFAARLSQWRREGFPPIRDDWARDGYGIGRSARVVGAGEEIAGVIAGLAPDGGLRLAQRGRIVVVRAGSLLVD